MLYLLFADDGILLCDKVTDIPTVLAHLWSEAQKVGLGPNDKTVIKIFGKRPPKPSQVYHMGSLEVKFVHSQVKYLGIWFMADLSFRVHVKQVVARANQTLSGLARLNVRFPFFTCQQEERMWVSVALSRLWGSELWFFQHKKEIDDLDDYRLRKMHGVSKNCKVDAIRFLFGYIPAYSHLVMKAFAFYWKMWDKKDYSLEKQSLVLLWDAVRHGSPELVKDCWVLGLVRTAQHFGYKNPKVIGSLLRNEFEDTGEGFQRLVNGHRKGFFQQVQLHSWFQVKEKVNSDLRLGFLWNTFHLRPRSARQVNKNILLKHKRSFVRLFCSQHRFEVEYLRYFKGDNCVARDQRFCSHCSRLGRQFVGNEQHFVYHCPLFSEVRKNLLSDCHSLVRKWHLRGCIQNEGENSIEFSKRNKSVKSQGDTVRATLDWVSLLQEVHLEHIISGYFRGICMPIEGYREISRFVGKFIHVIVEHKRLQYESLRLDFRSEVVYDRPEDQGEVC